MKKSTNTLNETVERMSTGYKINHARDNAANYSINTSMTTKIGGYQVAEDNAAMGLDMLNTASDNLSVMQSKATRLRELAIQARNGTYGGSSLSAIQTEANAIYEEINRIYSTAEYNGVKLFNQSEYDIPDDMPKADPITGFIENPYDYTEDDLKNITSISKVTDSFTESTYKIETVDDLVKLAELTNNGVNTTGKTFVLANDLDLKEYCEQHEAEGGWTPIGNETNKFKGTFNGNGHVISNLTINRPNSDYQALFGSCKEGTKIYNIGLNEVNIVAKSYVGSILGYIHTSSLIINCYAEGSVIGNNNVGGLFGRSYAIKTEGCYFEGNITADNYVGGLTGYQYYGVSNCYTDAIIQGNYRCGGLFGWAYLDSAHNVLENSYSKGTVIAKNFVGGLIGELYFTSNNSKNIINCYSYSKVSALSSQAPIGSLIGHIFLAQGHNLFPCNIAISNCYALEQGLELIGIVSNANTNTTEAVPEEFLSGIQNLKLNNINTNLQIGTKSESASQLSLNTNFELDLGKVVRFGIGSDFALSAIDDFVNLLSKKQTEYGATQNRLMSVLDEIQLQQENLISARSTTRDADIAKVSSAYIQQQILQQASATLMATANQSPSIALQLI
ncbi:flagellin [bacterium]|nr:flagellin [bacterium]